jgi:hypothetical protein
MGLEKYSVAANWEWHREQARHLETAEKTPSLTHNCCAITITHPHEVLHAHCDNRNGGRGGLSAERLSVCYDLV